MQYTQEFLTATAQQRVAPAKQQAQELQQFHRDLFISIFGIVKR
ncbi:MAG: gas vesicle protein GvpC [Scytonema sp. PMC 1069.18]|nr:gas vesicle protein GvpC [Scytonema sp. PMC 1069.18]